MSNYDQRVRIEAGESFVQSAWVVSTQAVQAYGLQSAFSELFSLGHMTMHMGAQ